MSAVPVEGALLSAQETFVSPEGNSHEAEGDEAPGFGRDEQEGK